MPDCNNDIDKLLAALDPKPKVTVAGCLTATLLALVLIPVGIFGYALAVSKLWFWFVASPFGVHPIGLAHAYGLFLLVTLFVAHLCYSSTRKIRTTSELVGALIGKTIVPYIFLGIGYIVHWLMV